MRRDGWLTLMVAVVAGVVQWPIYDRWLGLLDEGYVLGIADQVNAGKILYRDVVVDAPFPGAFYLLAWWFRAAGTSVVASRLIVVTGFAAYAAATFYVARAVLPRRWALALVPLLLCHRIWAFPHWHTYSYSLVAALLATVAAALVASTAERRAAGRLVLAGLAAGGAIVCKQDYGVAVAGALGLALLLLPWVAPGDTASPSRPLRPAMIFGGTIVATLLPPLAWLGWHGALDAAVQQTLLFPLEVMSRFSYTRLPSLWPLFGQDAAFRAEIGSYFPGILVTLWWGTCPGCWVSDLSLGRLYNDTAFWDVALKLVYWAPIFAVGAAGMLWGAGIARARRRGRPRHDAAARVVLLAWAGGFLLAFSRPRDWVHLMMIFPPALVVGVVLLRDACERLPAALARAVRTAGTTAVVLGVLVSTALAMDMRRQIAWPLDLPRAGVYADPHNGPIIQDVVAYVNDHVPAGEPLPVFPTQPMLGFLTGREPAGGYSVIWPFQNAQRDARIVADLERRRIFHVVYAVSQYAHIGSFRSNAPALYDHLVARYEIDRVFSREAFGPTLVALRRRDDAPDAIPLRAALGDAGRAGTLTWARWPFGEVLAQAITPPGAERPLLVPVQVPRTHPILRLAAGVNPDRWLGLTRGPFTFRVAIEGPEDQVPHLVAERVMNPGLVPADRRWWPIEVDLSDVAGTAVVVALTIEADGSGTETGDLAGWMEPRFARRSAAEEPVS